LTAPAVAQRDVVEAWIALGLSEYRDIWDRFERTFRFHPSMLPADFPGIDEPSPSVTFALPRVEAEKRLPTDAEIADLKSAMLSAFRLIPGAYR
jgi:hypothetical protein